VRQFYKELSTNHINCETAGW